MTTKQMETKNRHTRIVRALLNKDCSYEIAKREGVSRKQVGHIAKREAIPECTHARAGHECVKPIFQEQ